MFNEFNPFYILKVMRSEKPEIGDYEERSVFDILSDR